MRHTQAKIAAVALQVLLHLALGLAFLGAVYTRFYSGWLPVADLPHWPSYLAYFVASFTLWSVLETKSGFIYHCIEARSFPGWMMNLVRLDLVTLALISGAAFFWRGYSFSRITVACFWGFHLLLGMTAAGLVRAWWRRRAGEMRVAVLLLGDKSSLEQLRRECVPPRAQIDVRCLAGTPAALALLERGELPENASEVLVALSTCAIHDWDRLAEALHRLPVPASLVLTGLGGGPLQATPSCLVLQTGPRAAGDFDYVFSKRVVDVIVSGLALFFLSPVLAWIACGIWRRSGRPVLLRQERVGKSGRRFRLYKFRTLAPESLGDSDSCWAAEPPDAWSRRLRNSGLDELPQLWNVLWGHMSLVGPRPERPYFVRQFRQQLPFYATRHRLQAGLTGWAQVHGWRGDTSIARRIEYDLYYLRHWSLALDFRILWMTLTDFVRGRRRNAGAPQRASDAGIV